MMELLSITSLEEMKVIQDWLAGDETSKKELSEYLKIDNWFNLLKPNIREAFFVVFNHEKIGFIDLEMQDTGKAYFSFYIIPEKRNQGFGMSAITNLIETVLTKNIRSLVAGVNIDNFSSQKVLKRQGFKYTVTQDGYMYFELKIEENNKK